MSAGTGGFRWDDPYRTGQAGFFDMNTMRGLMLRAQRGDLQAKHHLAKSGMTDQWGNFTFNAGDVQAGNYAPAVSAWAQSKNLQPYNQGPAFQWQDSWATGDPSFEGVWNNFFGGMAPAQARVDAPDKPLAPVIGGVPGNAPLNPGAQGAQPAVAAPGANQGGTVAVQPDGSWRLPNGTVIPPNMRTTVDIRGTKVALPFYNGSDMPGRGEFRFTDGVGRQMNALGLLVQRLGELHQAGQNVNDPSVIYGAIARIRDDAKASGVVDADLDRATGIGGLQNFIRYNNPSTGTGAPPAASPPGTPPAPGQGGGGNGAAPGQTGTGPGAPQQPAPTQPPPPGSPPNTGAPGSGSGDTMRNIALFNDPNAQAMEVYQRLGIDPTRNGIYTGSIMRTVDPIVQAWSDFNQINAGPNDPTAIDSIQGRLNALAGHLGQGGGGMGAIRQDFRSAMGDPRFAATLKDLGDEGAIDTMQTGVFGSNVGSNALVSRAMANRFNAAFGPMGRYRQYALNNIQNPNYLNPRDWVLQSEWADLLNDL